MRYVLTADLQLALYDRYSKPHDRFFTTRLDDMLLAFCRVVDYAKDNDAALIVAGDIFDDRKAVPIPVVDLAVDAFRAAGKQVDVFVIPGNHDSYNKTPEFTSVSALEGPGVTVVRGKPQMLDGGILLAPWTDSFSDWLTAVKAAKKKNPDAKYLVSHGLLDAVHPGGWPIDDMPLDLFKRIMLGDVHDPLRFEGGMIQYIGSPYQINYRDCNGERGCWLFDTVSNKLSFHENKKSPRFFQINSYRDRAIRSVCKGDFVQIDAETDTIAGSVLANLPEGVILDVTVAPKDHDAATRLGIKSTDSIEDMVKRYVESKGMDPAVYMDYAIKAYRAVSERRGGGSQAMGRCYIAEVRYVEFGPFEDVTINFQKPGITAIEGQVDFMAGCDNNGAGKSMLLDGAYWCLTGEALRDGYTGLKYMRRGSDKPMYVETNIRNKDRELLYTVTRKCDRKGKLTVLFEDADGKPVKGVESGTNTMTTQRIYEVLGADPETLLASTFFAARDDVADFWRMSDEDKKSVLEKLFGVVIFAEVLKNVVADVKTKLAALSSIERERQDIQQALDAAKQVFTDDDAKQAGELEAEFEQAAHVAGLLSKRVGILQAVYADWDDEQRKLLTAVAKLNQTPEDEKTKYTREAWEKAKSDHDATTAAINDCSRKMEDLRKRKDGLVQGKTCSACGQKIGNMKDARRHAAEVQREMDALGVEIDKHEMQLDLDKGRLKDAAAAHEKSAAASKQAQFDTRTAELACSKEGRTIRDRLDRCSELAADAVTEAMRLEERLRGYTRSRQRAQEIITRETARLTATDEPHVQAKLAADVATFWKEGFGDKGLKSHVIESQLPEVSSRATRYARKLFGYPVTVKLSATTQVDKGAREVERISIHADIPGCAAEYDGCSKAQKRRFDLALILAFKEINANRKATVFGQQFFDEVFDHLDARGCETVIDIVKDNADGEPVLMVTHNDSLKGLTDRTIRVYHDGDKAVLEKG